MVDESVQTVVFVQFRERTKTVFSKNVPTTICSDSLSFFAANFLVCLSLGQRAFLNYKLMKIALTQTSSVVCLAEQKQLCVVIKNGLV